MSDTAAGQPSERTPDFIPGWFQRRGVSTVQVREAVRLLDEDAGVFPISFLCPGEYVRPAKPHRKGVYISTVDHDFGLAVPPGYWIVRDDGGELRNWRPDEFESQWVRLKRPWESPVARYEAQTNPTGDRDPGFASSRDGWKGTQPAEGTRRALIYGALLGREVLTADECLDHADAVEAALLESTIAAEEGSIETTLFRGDPHLRQRAQEVVDGAREAAATTATFVAGERSSNCPYGSSEPAAGSCGIGDCPFHHPKMQPGDVGEIDDPDAPDAEIVDSDGHPLAGLHVVVGAQDGVPYLSLIELEHLFSNLYEDITERQAEKQRRGEEEKAENTAAEPRPGEAVPYDHEDDRPLWQVELDRGLNHLRNAIADRLGL